MSNIQAALCLAQFQRLKELISKKGIITIPNLACLFTIIVK